jgi:hypothetical protein
VALADQVLVSSQVLTVVVRRLWVDLVDCLDYNQEAKEVSRGTHGMVTMYLFNQQICSSSCPIKTLNPEIML